MKRLPRRTIASLLIVIFSAITFSPLAIASLHSPLVMHAITGECTGDCRTCGCAPERSAAHTCCCWYKKANRSKKLRSHCTCCDKNESTSTVTIAGLCPCESGKHLDVCGLEEFQIVPHRLPGLPAVHGEMTLTRTTPARPPCRHDRPPVPPPE